MAKENQETTVEYDIQTIGIRDHKDLRQILAANYHKQIENFFGDPVKARKFLSSVMADVQRTPQLLECTPVTLINSYLVMAELGLMPSGVSGEAYVLPYKNKGAMQAQFQLGYQGLVTLLYRAGAREIIAELVRENDKFTLSRGKINHEVDPRKTKKDRGKVIGAYAIITTQSGGSVEQYMAIDDIYAHAKRFSKSYGSDFTPWNEKNDPEGWMPRKTVLKQAAKLAPKNETVYKAIAEDNRDSNIEDGRVDAALKEGDSLRMGNLLKDGNQDKETDADQTQDGPAESDEAKSSE